MKYKMDQTVRYQGEWWVIDERNYYDDLGWLYCMHDPRFEVRSRCAWEAELDQENTREFA